MTCSVTQNRFVEAAREIVVLRALYLGDLLCAIPFFRALREAAPRARIALASLPWAHAFVEHFAEFIDEFIAFPGFPGLLEQSVEPRRVGRFLLQMQARQFDLAIQLQGSGRHANEAISLFGADRMAGYYTSGDYCPDKETFLAYPTDVPEIHRHLKLLERLGISAADDALFFPVREEDDARLAEARILHRLGSDFICVHAGGKLATRRWPAERFAAVAHALSADGFAIALTGVEGERAIMNAVEQQLEFGVANLCGQTDLGLLVALVRRARLVITNDTGMSHIAAAVRTPSVVIGLGSDLQRWAPLDRRLHRVVSRPVDCRPCEFADCPIGFTCAESISPQMVIDVCRQTLSESRTNSLGREIMSPAPAAY
ncbi:MAG TPA: glycosyltransferase family 9 protein [Pirellulales bacterium]|nr:glycosyltransferase family 9 protein [Pirellulales bacterium]